MQTSGTRVLIVDDEPASRRLLEVRLRPLECDVAIAVNGEEALSAIRKDDPDLILLDLQMPKMGGIEVLRTLRAEGIVVPTIVITAHGSIETAVEAMKEGAQDFITKPIDAKHFDIVVRKALEREGLKRELELFSEDADRRYRLIIGKSEKMKAPRKPREKPLRARPRFCSLAKAAREKKSSRAPFTTGAREKTSRSLRSTVWVCPRSFSKASYSAMRRAPSRARTSRKKARWSWPTAAQFFSTKSAMSLRSFKPSF